MTEPSDANHVRQALPTLTLEGLAARLDALCDQAAKAAWSYATLLAHCLREALTVREARRLSVATNVARFPFHQTLAPCDVAFHPRVEKRRLQELAS